MAQDIERTIDVLSRRVRSARNKAEHAETSLRLRRLELAELEAELGKAQAHADRISKAQSLSFEEWGKGS